MTHPPKEKNENKRAWKNPTAAPGSSCTVLSLEEEYSQKTIITKGWLKRAEVAAVLCFTTFSAFRYYCFTSTSSLFPPPQKYCIFDNSICPPNFLHSEEWKVGHGIREKTQVSDFNAAHWMLVAICNGNSMAFLLFAWCLLSLKHFVLWVAS